MVLSPGAGIANAAGGLSFWSPACPAFSFASAPYPPTPPSPTGKGETKVIFMQGASPLASPGLNPRGTGKGDEPRTRRGLPPALPVDLAAVVLAGGHAFFVACRPCLLLSFLPPIPPTPFPGGEGGDQGYFMQGAPPLASPGAEPGRHLHDQKFLFVYGGAVPAAKERGDRGRGTSAFEMVLSPGAGIANAAGGSPFWLPANPAFSLLFRPPSPEGKDRPPGKGA